MAILAYIIARLKEPSTYAGLSVLLGLFGVKLMPGGLDAIAAVLASVAAAIAVFVPDLNKPDA